MANGDDDSSQPGPAYQTGPNAYGPQDNGSGSTMAFSSPNAASFMAKDPQVSLGTLDPGYPAQREARIDELAQRESGGQNIRNPASTASGPWQMTDPTWKTGTKLAGGDAPRYPTAASAPVGTQRNVVRAVYDQYGEKPWAETVRSSPVRVASRALADYTGKR